MALSTGTGGPVIQLRQYRLYPGTREHLIVLFDREFVETQEAVCMRVLGQFRDLDDPDSQFRQRVQAHDMHLESLASNDAWRTQALPAMDRLMWRRAQVLHPAPTARSLLGASA